MKRTIFLCILGITLSLPLHADNDGSTIKKIPLGGNSYLTTRGASGAVADAGFQSWSDPQTVFATYFRVNREGDLNLYLEYATDTEGNEIAVSCKNQTFSVVLPKPQVNKDTVVRIGTIDPCKPGHVQVNFQGKTLKGNTFAAPSALLVSGQASEDMNFVGDFSYHFGRRGPSVHLNYEIPADQTAEWFYNEVTVPEGQDPVGSYFMANGFGEGYFGIQVNSNTERRVLFSVWSPYKTDNPKEIPDDQKIILVKKGEGVKTGEFGNEGSGGQSYLIYNWEAGKTYRFLTHIRPAEKGYTEYTSYFYTPETKRWKLIAQFLRPVTTQYYTRPHSFLENFNPRTGDVGRKACYNNQWIYTTKGKWIELTHARFSADETARRGARTDYKGGADESGFFLQNCGFFDDNTEIGSAFDRRPGKKPEINWKKLDGNVKSFQRTLKTSPPHPHQT